MTTTADPDPPTTRTVASGRVRLHVQEWGEPRDPTVVLVHGYPDTTAVWDRVVPRLVDRCHVVAYDVRGAGGSSRPADVTDYAFAHLVEDLWAVCDAVSDGEPVHLVGHDWGAIQGWEAAADPAAAERLSGFTAVSGPSLDLSGHWARAQLHPGRLLALAAQVLRSWYIVAFQVPGAAPALWHQWLGARWGAIRRRTERDPGLPDPAPTIAEDGAAGVGLYRANAGRVASPVRSGVHVPTRVLVGQRDAFVGSRLFDGLEPLGVQVEILPDARHWLPLTHPEEVAATVLDHVVATAP